MNPHYQLIESTADLEKISGQMASEKTIAVDLESDSMYHFKEKVCLIQISANSTNFIIDPLKVDDVSSLKPIFANPDIKKVFHGADYDIRSLFRDFRFEVNNLFDTHLACRFLGYKETGLEALIQHNFNVALNKRFQKKDWSQRPLPAEMIDYAAQDALYLPPLKKILEKELKKQNRLSWVSEECNILSRVRPANNNHHPLYLNFKGAGSFKPRELAILEAILQLRKNIAEKKDKPLFKIFQNTAIVKIVKNSPKGIKRLFKMRALSPTQIDMYGEEIIQAILEAKKIPRDALPLYPRKRSPRLRMKDQLRIKILKDWKDTKANELNIEPALVLNKALIFTIAIENPRKTNELTRIKEMRNWQKKEFGSEIISILNEV